MSERSPPKSSGYREPLSTKEAATEVLLHDVRAVLLEHREFVKGSLSFQKDAMLRLGACEALLRSGSLPRGVSPSRERRPSNGSLPRLVTPSRERRPSNGHVAVEHAVGGSGAPAPTGPAVEGANHLEGSNHAVVPTQAAPVIAPASGLQRSGTIFSPDRRPPEDKKERVSAASDGEALAKIPSNHKAEDEQEAEETITLGSLLRSVLSRSTGNDTAPKDYSDLSLRRYIERNPFRGTMRLLVQNPFFDNFFMLVVTCSLVLVGLEVEFNAQRRDVDRQQFLSLQGVCCALFAFECLCRVGAYGRDFALGRDWQWNVFDVVCLLMMIVELYLEVLTTAAEEEEEGPIIRIARMLRILRVVRIMRATRASREFRKMIYALQYSAQTLFWALLLLFFVMFFFATSFTQATTEVVVAKYGRRVPISDLTGELGELSGFFGTLPRSFYSLFTAVASGRDWYELLEPMNQLHWFFHALFMLYVSITIFGVMNVVTSVFVESALQSVQHYKDLMIQESLKAKQMYMDHLMNVFKEIDSDGSGAITEDELDQFLEDAYLQMYLESMDIQPHDARMLFTLLDKDGSGSVSIEEFCNGCMKLKGEAKSFDMHCIIFENQRLTHKWRELEIYLENSFGPELARTVEIAFDDRMGSLLGPGGLLTPKGMSATLSAALAMSAEEADAPPQPPSVHSPKKFF